MTRPRSRCIVCHKPIQLNRQNVPQSDGDACWDCMAYGNDGFESRAEIAEWAREELELRAGEARARKASS